MKIKIARIVMRLIEAGVFAPCSDLFKKRNKGEYSLMLTKGPYFSRQPVVSRNGSESALLEPLLAIGFDEAAAGRLVRQYSPRLLREWSDITLAARERSGPAFFKRSPQAYFVDNVRRAAAGERTAPDWWHEVRKAEQAAADRPITEWLVEASQSEAKDRPLESQSREAYAIIRNRLFGDFLAAGTPNKDAAEKAERLAKDHMSRSMRPADDGLTRAGAILKFPTR